jgi:Protein of unknown function (DUF4236)/Bacterial SH3 domain
MWTGIPGDRSDNGFRLENRPCKRYRSLTDHQGDRRTFVIGRRHLMRFRKSIRLAPGVRINLSRSGVSTTFGGRGASVNVGKRGTRATVGIPGTGISFSQRVVGGSGGGASNAGSAQGGGCAGVGCLGFVVLVLMAMCGDSDGPSSADRYPARYDMPSYSAPVTTETRESFYIHGTLNVRAAPDKNAELVRTLRRGDYVQLSPKDASGWARLYSPGSAEGYVYRASDLVRRQAPSVRSAASSGGGGGSRRSSAESRGYYTGPRGGCYYYSGSGRKQYVDRSYCN